MAASAVSSASFATMNRRDDGHATSRYVFLYRSLAEAIVRPGFAAPTAVDTNSGILDIYLNFMENLRSRPEPSADARGADRVAGESLVRDPGDRLACMCRR